MSTAVTELEQRVRALVAEVLWLDPTDLDGATPLVDYGVDSPMAMELAVQVEDTFGVELSEDDIARLQTIDQIVAHLAADEAGP